MGHELHIEVIARGLCLAAERVLVCRNVVSGYLYLPGGHVEFGEAAGDSLRREFVEETGLSVAVGDLLLTDEQAFIQNGRERHELNLVFHVEHREWGGRTPPPPVPSLEPKIAFDWVPRSELLDAKLYPSGIAEWILLPAPRPHWRSSGKLAKHTGAKS